jgi:hypothetical protein
MRGLSTDWFINKSVDWLTVEPEEGMTEEVIYVTVDRTGLETGIYKTTLVIDYREGLNKESVSVTMEVGEANLGTVEGYVYDKATNDGIGGVMVQCESTSIVVTIPSGHYSIINVPSGTQTIYATKPGYYDYSEEITVASGLATVHDIYMEQEYIILNSSPLLR